MSLIRSTVRDRINKRVKGVPAFDLLTRGQMIPRNMSPQQAFSWVLRINGNHMEGNKGTVSQSIRDRLYDVGRLIALEAAQRNIGTQLLAGAIMPKRKSTGQDLMFYARSTAIPSSTQTSIRRHYSGVEYSYAGKETSPDIFRVTFWDDEDLTVYSFMTHWFKLMHDEDYKRSVDPVDYMRNIELDLIDRTDSNVTANFEFTDAYPIEINEAVLSYESSEVLTFDVVFSFVRKYETFR